MKIFFLPSPQNSLIRGILTFIIGVLFLSLPGLTLKSVIMTIGAIILASGIINLLLSLLKSKRGNSIGSSFQGFFNVLLGILFLLSPMTIVEIFGFFFGIIFLLLGLMQFFGAIGTISKSLWSLIYLIFSMLLIFGGVFLLVHPIKSAENILIFFGAILLIYGILEIIKAWQIRKIPKGTNEGNIIDTTFEEV